MRPGCGAVLVPTVNLRAWELGLGCRVVLFRDWGWADEDGNYMDVRLAEIVKAEGIGINSSQRGRIIGFGLSDVSHPLHPLHLNPMPQTIPSLPK